MALPPAEGLPVPLSPSVAWLPRPQDVGRGLWGQALEGRISPTSPAQRPDPGNWRPGNTIPPDPPQRALQSTTEEDEVHANFTN